jgi:hypothetical protein
MFARLKDWRPVATHTHCWEGVIDPARPDRANMLIAADPAR